MSSEDHSIRTATAPRIEALLDAMTLEEQVSLLAGADFWRTVAIPRLNIPALKVTDGPAGARGGGPLVGGKQTAAFPVGIALGSTWNVDLLREVGAYLAQEAKDKGASALLGPTINIFRSTLNGRNFENYAEDPFLAGQLAVAYTQGLQAEGVAATIKHFAGNESEYQRNTINSEIPERAFRELYLLPFEMAVKAGGAWAIMSAYNKLNNLYCSENPWLLNEILRNEWGFDGLVMSDWGGTHSAGASVRAGLDLEMPGPARARANLLAEAEADDATRAAVRAAARNVLRLLERTGTLAAPRDVRDDVERDQEHPATRALIRRAGAEGTVLLKNEGNLLPLPANAKVAVIGPNAATAQVMGGGSAQMNAHRKVSPLDGLREALGATNVAYAIGCDNDKFLPIPDVVMQIDYRAADGAAVLAHEVRPLGEVMWFALPAGVPSDFRANLTTTLNIAEAGKYDFSLTSAGLSRLSIDGEAVIDNWTNFTAGITYFGFGSDEVRASRTLSAGDHAIVIEFTPQKVDVGSAPLSAVRFGFRKPLPENSVQEAARVAAEADYALVCIGTNGDWETEGVDRWGLALPGQQDSLVQAVAQANPHTIVLLQTGGPVLMPWLADVSAVVQAWFPGQEAGYAIADVLLGHAEPGGRLPQTFPARLADDPVHPETSNRQYPGEDGHVAYREGLFIGYRHVDYAGLTPLFPFGFGLSYTTFRYSNLRLSAETFDEQLTVSVDITNTGTRAGQEIVQVYVRDPEAQLERPEKELKGFVKLALAPAETKTATVTLDHRSLAYWDDQQHTWIAEAGAFEVLVGSSSASIHTRASFQLAETLSL